LEFFAELTLFVPALGKALDQGLEVAEDVHDPAVVIQGLQGLGSVLGYHFQEIGGKVSDGGEVDLVVVDEGSTSALAGNFATDHNAVVFSGYAELVKDGPCGRLVLDLEAGLDQAFVRPTADHRAIGSFTCRKA
jgi:hypothetical protein